MISDKKVIARNYLSGWFFIDLISILPFDKMIKVKTKNTNSLQLVKMTRLSRISKFIRLMKVVRMTKMLRLCKNRQHIEDSASDLIKIHENAKKMLKFLVVILLINHIMACLWVFSSKLNDETNWLKTKIGDEKISNFNLYVMAFYFVSTTVTTVGYGDMYPTNTAERFLAIILLFVGVICFASISGSLTAIITQSENQQVGLRIRLETLQNLKQQHRLDPKLTTQLRDAIRYEYSKAVDGLDDLMDSLPINLKMKLASAIHGDVLCSFKFFKEASLISKTYMSWIGHRLIPRLLSMNQFVYEEKEDIQSIYFISAGELVFCLPKKN